MVKFTETTITSPAGQGQTLRLTPGVYEYTWHIGNAYGGDYAEGVYILSVFLDSKLVDVEKVLFKRR